MVQIENTIIASDIFSEYFTCDIAHCKGSCCVDGDAGAPLEESELDIIEAEFTRVRPLLSAAALSVIEREGYYIRADENTFYTPIIDGGICVYAAMKTGAKGCVQCAFQLNHKAKKSTFEKPISCHLYPIRITKTTEGDMLNYERIINCVQACALGEKKKIRLFEFLKQPLIRKYGEAYYRSMEEVARRFFR